LLLCVMLKFNHLQRQYTHNPVIWRKKENKKNKKKRQFRLVAKNMPIHIRIITVSSSRAYSPGIKPFEPGHVAAIRIEVDSEEELAKKEDPLPRLIVHIKNRHSNVSRILIKLWSFSKTSWLNLVLWNVISKPRNAVWVYYLD